MKKIIRQIATVLIIMTLGIIANAAKQDERITLKNGKAKETVTLNPSRTYRFVISGKEFSKLSIALQTKGGKLVVEIKTPKGKTIASGSGERFTIQNAQRIEKGDFQIILKNIGKSAVSGELKIGDLEGESQ